MDLPGNTAIRDFMDKLTATTNVSKYVELPMIAVMGDTSSGKSSLLSSISLVELPSSSELTTRCPIMLKMCRSDTNDIDFTTTTIHDSQWESLPNEIARAQAHIIKITAKEVARDIVKVNVYSPDCHDLTLIDLPGIVRSRGEKEGQSLVEDIKSLIEDYLNNTRCVILAVVPANVDFHNSQIMANAKEVDPETRRTIPVITKPDLIEAGGENEVLELLHGRKIKFDLGFHMVVGRGQAALDKGTSIAAGIQAEKSFFDNTQPWRDDTNRDLFGTVSLRSKLGELQMNMIRDTIPDIVKDMREQKHVADAELQEMGQQFGTSSERMMYFRDQTHKFLLLLDSSLTGSKYTGNDRPASAKLHEAAKRLQECIAKGRLANITKISVGMDVVVTTKDGDWEGRAVAVTENSVEVDFEEEGEEAEEGKKHDDRETESFLANQVRRDPSWLMKIIKARRTHSLPCFLNEDVFRNIATELMEEDFMPPCKQLLDDSFRILKETIEQCLASSGMKKRYQGLGIWAEQRAQIEVERLLSRERVRLKNYLEDELDPYTQNHYLFENLSKKRNERLKRKLVLALDGIGSKPQVSSTNSVGKRIQTIVDAVFDQNQRKSVDEHVAEEMEAVLDAYGKVAMKRIIDLVPMGCRRIFRDTPDAIRRSLDEVTDADLSRFMQDSKAFRQKYQELESQVAEMEKGLALFSELS